MVEEYSDLLYRYALQRVPDPEQCKDLLQECFLAAWRNLDGYKSEASEKNWLFVILKSKIVDYYRKRKQEEESVPEDETSDAIYFDENDHWRRGYYPKHWSVDLTNATEAKDFQQVFQGCRKKLRELQHDVFVMKYLDDRQSEEICRELGLKASHYWVLLHRAKVQLRACLEKNWNFK